MDPAHSNHSSEAPGGLRSGTTFAPKSFAARFIAATTSGLRRAPSLGGTVPVKHLEPPDLPAERPVDGPFQFTEGSVPVQIICPLNLSLEPINRKKAGDRSGDSHPAGSDRLPGHEEVTDERSWAKVSQQQSGSANPLLRAGVRWVGEMPDGNCGLARPPGITQIRMGEWRNCWIERSLPKRHWPMCADNNTLCGEAAAHPKEVVRDRFQSLF